MAQRVSVVLVDDLDGGEAAETVSFGLDGADYEIDLSDAHAAELRDALATYVGHGRRLTGRRRSTNGGRRTSSSAGGAGGSGASAADIRAWARDSGHKVTERGRISAEVREAYAAAH